MFYCHTLATNRTAVSLLTVSGWRLPGNDWWEPTVFGQPSQLPTWAFLTLMTPGTSVDQTSPIKKGLINHTNAVKAVGLVFIWDHFSCNVKLAIRDAMFAATCRATLEPNDRFRIIYPLYEYKLIRHLEAKELLQVFYWTLLNSIPTPENC